MAKKISTEYQEDHQTTLVQFQESIRAYYAQIPHIVYELLEDKFLSVSEFVLYCVYRRVAGEYGRCWIGTRDLAEKCNLSKTTISDSKNNLAKKFKKLSNKPLIHITKGDKKRGRPDTITIIDIWPENQALFQKIPTCPPGGTTCPPGGTTCPPGGTEEELYKKNIKEDYYCDPQIRPNEKVSKTKSPAGGNNNFSHPSSSKSYEFYLCLNECDFLSPRQKSFFNKFSEDTVAKAVKYCNHPKTVLQGPEAKLKQLTAFCNNPLDYQTTFNNLDKPCKKPLEQALQYNTLLGKINPNLAKINPKFIEEGSVVLILDGEQHLVSFASDYFQTEITKAMQQLKSK